MKTAISEGALRAGDEKGIADIRASITSRAALDAFELNATDLVHMDDPSDLNPGTTQLPLLLMKIKSNRVSDRLFRAQGDACLTLASARAANSNKSQVGATGSTVTAQHRESVTVVHDTFDDSRDMDSDEETHLWTALACSLYDLTSIIF